MVFMMIGGATSAYAVPTCSTPATFMFGDDNNGDSGRGLSVWTANTDGTFNTTKIMTGGFDRESDGTKVFGKDLGSKTYFADVNNDGYVDIVHATDDNDNEIHVWLNNRDNTFQTTAIVTTGF